MAAVRGVKPSAIHPSLYIGAFVFARRGQPTKRTAITPHEQEREAEAKPDATGSCGTIDASVKIASSRNIALRSAPATPSLS